MLYKLTTLPNGLRVITVNFRNLESVAVTLWVGVGSRFEEDKEAGVSHFLEHMIFKGSKKFRSALAISSAVDSIGADINGGTSHEWTQFYIKSQASQIDKSFEILADIVLNPLLKASDINRERGVLLEEVSMHKDNPMERIGDIFMSLVFKGNPLGREIIGSIDTIKTINRDTFENYRQKHYRAQNMVLTVTGKMDDEKVLRLAEKYFGELESGTKEEALVFDAEKNGPKLKLEYKDTEQAHLFTGFYGYNRRHKNRFAEGILATILGKGMSSRLFTEIREKRGLAYAIGTSVSRFNDSGVFATYAGINPNNIKSVIKLILKQCYGVANGSYPIREKELKKAKEFIKGKLALALEDTIEVNEFFGQRAMFLPEIDTPEEFFAKVDKVTIADVVKAANKIFVPEKLNVAVIGPYKDETEIRKILV